MTQSAAKLRHQRDVGKFAMRKKKSRALFNALRRAREWRVANNLECPF